MASWLVAFPNIELSVKDIFWGGGSCINTVTMQVCQRHQPDISERREMVPKLRLWERIFCWILFRYEDFEDLDEAEFNIHNGLTKTHSLMRNYVYYLRSK